MYGLRQTVAPATSPVTTTEAKLHARLDVDTIDADIQMLIDGATEQIEGLIDRQIVTATYRFTMPCWPPTLWLPLGRTQSVTSIKAWGAKCTASRNVNAPTSWAQLQICFTGLAVPVAFEAQPTATSRV